MALINCWECEEKISTSAEACPKCGAPSKDAQLQQSKVTVNTLGIDPEIHKEMLAQANISVKRKKLLKSLKDIVVGKVHEKFFNSKEEGEKIYAQVEWKHFFIDDHDKDKTIQTHVSKSTGGTSNGGRYVKDVNVSTTTTHYDYINVIDLDDNKSTFRLVDCSLTKLNPGQVISLGWVKKSNSSLTDDVLSADAWQVGQTWSDDVQPSIFVSHEDPKGGNEINWQALASSEFKDLFISSKLGKWHMLWLAPAISLLGMPSSLLIASLATIITLTTVKVIRNKKADEQLELFSEWYRNEADLMLTQGSDLYKQLN